MTVVFEGKISLISEVLKGKDSLAWAGITMANLRTIAASKTGRCVLNELAQSPRQIKIKPYYDQTEEGWNNAYSGEVSTTDAYLNGHPVRDGEKGNVTGEGSGTGLGSDVVVRYTPWRVDSSLQAATLLHEFVHTTEQLAGQIFCNKLAWKFDTTAEFDAILVENIYRSEVGLPSRRDHWDVTTPRSSDMMIPQLSGLKKLIASFRTRMPRLTSALAGIDTAFNPLRPGAKGYVGV